MSREPEREVERQEMGERKPCCCYKLTANCSEVNKKCARGKKSAGMLDKMFIHHQFVYSMATNAFDGLRAGHFILISWSFREEVIALFTAVRIASENVITARRKRTKQLRIKAMLIINSVRKTASLNAIRLFKIGIQIAYT